MSVQSVSRIDVQSKFDAHDDSFDLVDINYRDPEYTSSLLYQEEEIPAALENNNITFQPSEYKGHGTDPVLRDFVMNAMTFKEWDDSHAALTATQAVYDLVLMITDGINDLPESSDQEKRLVLHLKRLLTILQGYLDDISDECLSSWKSMLVPMDHESRSLFSRLHKTLWTIAYTLGMVGKKKYLDRDLVSEDLEDLMVELRQYTSRILSAKAIYGKVDRHAELQARIHLRPGMDSIQLHLTDHRREIIHEGNLFRKGSVNWLETHVIVFDHYMILAKAVLQKDANGVMTDVKYDVTKLPIPMDLLSMESTNDPVISAGDATNAIKTSTKLSTLWPFRVKHLGRSEVYTLAALSSSDREYWCSKIIEAKQKNAISLSERKREPFQLRVLANTAFVWGISRSDMSMDQEKGYFIRDTPLDRAMQDFEEKFNNGASRALPKDSGAVTCATTFDRPDGGGTVTVVGTAYGVFMSDYNTPGTWTRVRLKRCLSASNRLI